jgi:hypothetical protein
MFLLTPWCLRLLRKKHLISKIGLNMVGYKSFFMENPAVEDLIKLSLIMRKKSRGKGKEYTSQGCLLVIVKESFWSQQTATSLPYCGQFSVCSAVVGEGVGEGGRWHARDEVSKAAATARHTMREGWGAGGGGATVARIKGLLAPGTHFLLQRRKTFVAAVTVGPCTVRKISTLLMC